MSTIIDSRMKAFELPTEGEPHAATIVSVKLDKAIPNPFGDEPKDRITLKFEVTDELDSEGRPKSFLAFYNASLNEKAKLRKVLKLILGHDVGETYDIDTLVGTQAIVVTENVTRGNKTYANLLSVTKAKQAKKPAAAVIPPAPVFNEDADDSESLGF
jgi:hypothetical protein